MNSLPTFRPLTAFATAMAMVVCVSGGFVKADDAIQIREMQAALSLSVTTGEGEGTR